MGWSASFIELADQSSNKSLLHLSKFIMKQVFTFTLLLLAGFILYPAFFSIWTLFTDPGIRNGGPTKISFKIHKSLSTRLP